MHTTKLLYTKPIVRGFSLFLSFLCMIYNNIINIKREGATTTTTTKNAGWKRRWTVKDSFIHFSIYLFTIIITHLSFLSTKRTRNKLVRPKAHLFYSYIKLLNVYFLDMFRFYSAYMYVNSRNIHFLLLLLSLLLSPYSIL